MISRLPVARQFMVLALLGMALTVGGLLLGLKRSHDLAYEAKRSEIRHETEEGASIIRAYVAQEQSGAMTRAQAQQAALDAVGAIRFEDVNYVAVTGFDGVLLMSANKSIIGKNIIDLQDPTGRPFVRQELAIAMSGKPGFNEFVWKKIGETTPKLKINYNIGIPEWQMDVSSGDFADDLDSMLVRGITELLEIFVPFFLAYLAVVYFMHRGISTLLGSLRDAMTRLAKGDLGTEAVRWKRRDEIGQMANAFETFRQAARDKARLEAETAGERRRADDERSIRDQTKAAAAEEQGRVVEALAKSLQALSEGDLTCRLTEAFPPDYDKLRSDFNGAVEKLQETLQVIATNAMGIQSGSGEITAAADDLARRTEQQAASLEQTAAALDQITATVRKTAEGTDQARRVVSTARKEAETSGSVVQEAVKAMDAIEKSSSEIGQIIGVIDEIAFQTNLLALNAGVEAARAGDAGRGFAVVASEVRALAQRSAEAAKEIKSLISVSTAHVTSGVKLVNETGQALGRIVTQVTELNGMILDIAGSATEQATGLGQVNTAVNQMDQVTQQNAAMVEQTTAASHSLAQETQQLSALISRFRVIDGDKAPVRGEPSVSRSYVPSAGQSAKRAVPGKPTRRGGSSALTLSASPNAGWEEF